jgi:dihydroorotate dehydrogenase
VLGINIGASRPSFISGRAIKDYGMTHHLLRNAGDYYVDNVSTPNTEGVRGLQEPEILDELLFETDNFHIADEQGVPLAPRLLKFAPDLSWEQLDKALEVASRHNVHGVVLTNTTTSPEIKSGLHSPYRSEMGGVSGRPLTARAREVTQWVYKRTEGRMPIIRAGGVMTWEDYYEAITHGASLVQVYTALVNRDTSRPTLAYNFNKELAGFMHSEGIKSLDEIRGSGLRIGEVYEDYFG